MEEGGIVPPHSVLAPGTALELLRKQSSILRPGQLYCRRRNGDALPEHTSNPQQEGEMTKQDSAGCSIREVDPFV